MEAAEQQALAAQALFLQRLQYHLPPGIPLNVALADALGLSKSVTYKKINGESPLSTAQLQHLCNRFECSYHLQGYQHRQEAFIDFTPFYKNNIGVAEYIGGLKKFLTQITKATPTQLTCATDDIPIFHLFKYPELTAFKLHFWQLRVVDNSPFAFNMNDWSASLLAEAAQLHTIYNQIPSTEIWTKTNLLKALEQIKHAADGYRLGAGTNSKTIEAVAGIIVNTRVSAKEFGCIVWTELAAVLTFMFGGSGTAAQFSC